MSIAPCAKATRHKHTHSNDVPILLGTRIFEIFFNKFLLDRWPGQVHEQDSCEDVRVATRFQQKKDSVRTIASSRHFLEVSTRVETGQVKRQFTINLDTNNIINTEKSINETSRLVVAAAVAAAAAHDVEPHVE